MEQTLFYDRKQKTIIIMYIYLVALKDKSKKLFLHASSSLKNIIMFHLFTTTFIFFEYSVLVVNESKDNIILALLCQL